jgi:phage gp29-like protein
MSWWDRLWGRTPPPTVLADVKALPPAAQEMAPPLNAYQQEQYLEVLRASERPPSDPGDIIQPGSQMCPTDTITPERFQWIKKEADIGNTSQLMEVFDDVALDAHVGSQLRTRKLTVAGAPAIFESGDGSDLGKTIAEDAEKEWSKFRKRRQLIVDILDDFYRGFSCIRPIVDSVDGKWRMVDHQRVDSRYFRFVDATKPIITPFPGGFDGVDVPPGYLFSEHSDNPGPIVRQGVGRPVAKMYVYQGYFWVYLASYLERFGSPHVSVTTPRALREGSPELAQIKTAAQAFVQEHVGILPDGATLQVLEAVNKGVTVKEVYLAAITFCQLCESKSIVGQVLTADAGPGGIGHGGAAEEQGEVRQDLVEADGGRIEDLLTAQWWTPWTRWHYGPTAPVPCFKLLVTKPEDAVKKTQAQKQRAETLNILRNFIPLSKTQVYDEFECVEPDGEEDTIPVPVPPPDTTQGGAPAGSIAPAPAAKPAATPAVAQ